LSASQCHNLGLPLNSGNATETQDRFVYNCFHKILSRLSYNSMSPIVKLMKLMGTHCN